MVAPIFNNNVNIPQCEFLDPLTKRPARQWLVWLQYPQFVGTNLANPLNINSGGTGLSSIPTNGQLLIGNGTGYTLSTLTAGNGIAITNEAGSIKIDASSFGTFSAGSTGLTPAAPTAGTIVLGGVLNETHGGTGQLSYAKGDLLYAIGVNTLAKLPRPGVTSYLTMDGTGTPAWSTSTTVNYEGYVTATQGQTVVTVPFSYSIGSNALKVFVNGSKQVISLNYTETTTTSVTFLSGLNVGDIVEFIQ